MQYMSCVSSLCKSAEEIKAMRVNLAQGNEATVRHAPKRSKLFQGGWRPNDWPNNESHEPG